LRGKRNQSTDVCRVILLLCGYERWPFQIDRIELTALALIAYRTVEQPVCE